MKLLNTKEVAEMTGLSEGTLRYYRHTNQGPKSGKLGARRVVYRKADVEAWIEEQLELTARGGTEKEIA